jgi:hypothetical protein
MIILDPNEKGVPNNILVLLCAQFINGKYVPAQRELLIGCASVTSGPKKVSFALIFHNLIFVFFLLLHRMAIIHLII